MKFTTASTQSRVAFEQNTLLKGYIIIFFICWVITFIDTTIAPTGLPKMH